MARESDRPPPSIISILLLARDRRTVAMARALRDESPFQADTQIRIARTQPAALNHVAACPPNLILIDLSYLERAYAQGGPDPIPQLRECLDPPPLLVLAVDPQADAQVNPNLPLQVDMLVALAQHSSGLSRLIERLRSNGAPTNPSKDAHIYRALAEHSPAIGYVLELGEAARTLYVSPQLEELLGFSADEWNHDPDFWMKRLHPADRDQVITELALCSTAKRPFSGFTFRIRARSGEHVWFRSFQKIVEAPDSDGLWAFGWLLNVDNRLNGDGGPQEGKSDSPVEGEDMFNLLAEHLDQVFWLTNATQTKIVYLSPAFEKITGLPAETVLRQPRAFLKMVHPEDRKAVRFTGVSEGEDRYAADFRLVRPDGEIRWIRARGFPIRNAQGKIERLAGIAEDTTERRKALATLAQSEARYHSLFDNVPVGLYRTTPDGAILDINQAMVDMLGYPNRETLVAASAYDVQFNQGSREEWKHSLEEHDILQDYETQLTRYDGSSIWVKENARVIRDEHDAVLYYEGSMEDITQRKQAEDALRQEKEFSENLIHSSIDGILAFDRQYRYTMWNRGMERIWGIPAERVVGRVAFDVFPFLRDIGEEAYFEAALRGEKLEAADRPYSIEESERTGFFEGHYSPIVRDDGEILGGLAVIRDVTERKQVEEENLRLAAFPRENPDPILACDEAGTVIYLNPAAEAMLHELGKEDPAQILPPEHASLVQRTLSSGRSGREIDVAHGDRVYRWAYYPHPQFGVVHLYAHDITEQKHAERRLIHDALHDQLTGLPNRALFLDRLSQTVKRVQRMPGNRFAVLFLDLDRFKVVNDSLGHMIGDKLLVAVGERLRTTVRAPDTVARFGGDEFAVLLENVLNTDAAEKVARRIQAELERSFMIDDHEVFTGASIGIAVGDSRRGSPLELLRDADTAMYEAKKSGGAIEVFSDHMHSQAVALQRLETELRQAVERNEFSLRYQPIVALRNEHIVGFEALLRWDHPTRGLLPPSAFLDLALETGLIVPIGLWVLRTACLALKSWQLAWPRDPRLYISINVTAVELKSPDFLKELKGILADSAVRAQDIRFEITETTLMQDIKLAEQIIPKLKELGVKIQLDDFGAGYSSLSILQHFPIDALNVDRSFVRGIGQQTEGRQIIRSIVELARGLNIQVITEGIETEEELVQIRELQSEMGQGFLFSRPLDPGGVNRLLQLHKTSPGRRASTLDPPPEA